MTFSSIKKSNVKIQMRVSSKQVTFISEFLLKNSHTTENYSIITEMVSLRGVKTEKSRPRPQISFWYLFNKHS